MIDMLKRAWTWYWHGPDSAHNRQLAWHTYVHIVLLAWLVGFVMGIIVGLGGQIQ